MNSACNSSTYFGGRFSREHRSKAALYSGGGARVRLEDSSVECATAPIRSTSVRRSFDSSTDSITHRTFFIRRMEMSNGIAGSPMPDKLPHFFFEIAFEA